MEYYFDCKYYEAILSFLKEKTKYLGTGDYNELVFNIPASQCFVLLYYVPNYKLTLNCHHDFYLKILQAIHPYII